MGRWGNVRPRADIQERLDVLVMWSVSRVQPEQIERRFRVVRIDLQDVLPTAFSFLDLALGCIDHSQFIQDTGVAGVKAIGDLKGLIDAEEALIKRLEAKRKQDLINKLKGLNK